MYVFHGCALELWEETCPNVRVTSDGVVMPSTSGKGGGPFKKRSGGASPWIWAI